MKKFEKTEFMSKKVNKKELNKLLKLCNEEILEWQDFKKIIIKKMESL